MKVPYKKSLKYKVLRCIENTPGCALLRSDFSELGAKRQVNKVLKQLVEDGIIVRLGYGVYAKAYRSQFTGKVMVEDGFDVAVRVALNRLTVNWEPCYAEQEYNLGRTTQVPVVTKVKLNSRFKRILSYKKQTLKYER